MYVDVVHVCSTSCQQNNNLDIISLSLSPPDQRVLKKNTTINRFFYKTLCASAFERLQTSDNRKLRIETSKLLIVIPCLHPAPGELPTDTSCPAGSQTPYGDLVCATINEKYNNQ